MLTWLPQCVFSCPGWLTIHLKFFVLCPSVVICFRDKGVSSWFLWELCYQELRVIQDKYSLTVWLETLSFLRLIPGSLPTMPSQPKPGVPTLTCPPFGSQTIPSHWKMTVISPNMENYVDHRLLNMLSSSTNLSIQWIYFNAYFIKHLQKYLLFLLYFCVCYSASLLYFICAIKYLRYLKGSR